MSVLFWLRRPKALVARLRYWVWEKRNPDKPWLTPGAVRFCETALTRQMTGWEFGSGRSTVWFAARLARLVSVEHDPAWHQVVSGRLGAADITNVEYRLLPLDHPVEEGERPLYDPLPVYVAAIAEVPDESLHFVVVDGHYRSACIRVARPKLAPGGLLLVDDLELWRDGVRLPVPADWEQVHESSNGIKRTGVWKKPGSA